MSRKTWSVPVLLLAAACATPPQRGAYAQRTGAQVWINHDRESHAKIPKAPAFVE
jgi:hypothetical protein